MTDRPNERSTVTPTQREPTIAACCEKWQIVELALFGSVWRYVHR